MNRALGLNPKSTKSIKLLIRTFCTASCTETLLDSLKVRNKKKAIIPVFIEKSDYVAKLYSRTWMLDPAFVKEVKKSLQDRRELAMG